MPEAFRPLVAPLIPNIVTSVHQAFAIAIASTFWVSIGAAVLAAVIVLFLKEQPAYAATPDLARSPTTEDAAAAG